METGQYQKEADIDHACAIKLQLGNRYTPDSRQRNKMRKLFIPREMFVPEVSSRMIQRSDGLTHSIIGFSFVLFVSVASHTRKCKVVRYG